MTNIDYDAQDEYLAGYVRGRDDSKGRHPLYFTANSTAPHYICGYDDGYNGVPPQQFMKEGTTEDTQESEFDTIANAMTEWTPDDLSRMAYWALDLLHNKDGLTSEMDKCIGNAKLELQLMQQIINDRD